ncbi:MAG TPA: aconitate hydratase AcnA [Gaiellales bacterium]|jgi:aconitate hydratase|nr:aconitate hydratase AcnA [Gaiellales bacterium]
MADADPFAARDTLSTGEVIHRIDRVVDPLKLPYTICVLLENLLRRAGSEHVSEADVRALAAWPADPGDAQLAFMPARVIMQDLTGVPAVVDLAAMRSAVDRRGGDASRVDPLVPVDLVIDHSVQVDAFGSGMAYERNIDREYERNGERYALLRWAQEAFRNFQVVPPGMGIVHQVNLEYLGRVVQVRDGVAVPDTLVGTDSHTTMINALGVFGFGVGGIEAEAVMLGQPMYLTTPRVVGIRMSGELATGVTATDLVLTLTERLREHGVVGSFVEFFGRGVGRLTLADRATLSNMSPEFGATSAMFPIDSETLRYLRDTGRPAELVTLVEEYTKAQGLFRTGDEADPTYDEVLEFDLTAVEPSVAGPRRPQDRVALPSVGESFSSAFGESTNGSRLGNGSVAIAAITSCTNTSNPALMLAAGLVAQKAVERGLRPKPWVKTSLAPGSRVVIDYLERAGLIEPLNELGFNLVGFGCTTCIGNSGPLPDDTTKAIEEDGLAVAAVLSGNRNFEARIHPLVRANYLASPPLVVAFALAGSVAADLTSDPLGEGDDGPVYLRDVWPTSEEVEQALLRSISPELFTTEYGRIFDGDERWQSLPVPTGSELFQWDPDSTYVREASFFEHDADLSDIVDARVLALLGDSVTTDHISPAGAFAPSSPAGAYLVEHGVEPRDFNSYGARRGNHEVMVRGTFANIRLRNNLLDGVEGGYTVHLPDGEQMTIFEASNRYRRDGVPLIVIAGREYGSGSSRDWAAKGSALLGVRAVLVESFERIHRSNLVALGVLPLQFLPGESAASLGLTGRETYTIRGLADLGVGSTVTVEVDGGARSFQALARLDIPADVSVYRAGGLLQGMMRQLTG